jgi:hypothetical protein
MEPSCSSFKSDTSVSKRQVIRGQSRKYIFNLYTFMTTWPAIDNMTEEFIIRVNSSSDEDDNTSDEESNISLSSDSEMSGVETL